MTRSPRKSEAAAYALTQPLVAIFVTVLFTIAATLSLPVAFAPQLHHIQSRQSRTAFAGATAAHPARRPHTVADAKLPQTQPAPLSARAKPWAIMAAAWAAVRRVATHHVRGPVRRAQSPVAEIAIGLTLFGTIRAIVRSYHSASQSFALRDAIFQEMAVARTYSTSVIPWIQTGGIALVFSILIVVGIKKFMKSTKEWEERQEMKEMAAMGEDALFLMSTPIDATPLEPRAKKFKKKSRFSPLGIFGFFADKSQLLRVAACVGYLLPLLNVLDFGEISISLYPFPQGIPASEPIVNFMQNKLGMRFLYNAYLKSGYYFLIVWFIYIQLAVRNKKAPVFVRFHSSQAILMSMLLAVPQQIFFAVLNPWESGLAVQSFMYFSMVSIFLFTIVLVAWCCIKALLKQQMQIPLVSEAAVMWAGKERK